MLLRRIRQLLHRAPFTARRTFLSREAMLHLLERERLRCDRGGGGFVLLLVGLTERHHSPKNLVRMGRLMRGRLRTTDDIGLLESQCAGVLLTDTNLAGANRVVEDLTSLLAQQCLAARFRVLAYPTDDPSAGGNDTDDQDQNQGDRSEPSEALAPMFAQPLPSWKRLIDVVGATVGLILFSPFILAAAVAVKLTSNGPAFFTQPRAGLGSRPFQMIKLRTMVVEAEKLKQTLMQDNEQDGPAFKMRHDPRITGVGRFLRKTSIDELPQLWNVLRGDMSLVGPRPLPCHESNGCVQWQQRRLDVTPGLTCIWQVRGRSRVSFADWIRMDIQYIQSRSLAGDLALLATTIPAVLRGSGAQ